VPELRYLLYLGCVIPYRVQSYEVSARKVAERLGIGLVEMPRFNCCGLPLDPVSHETALALAARNLCLAEQQGLPLLALCSGCAGTLGRVNRELKGDRALRERVNGYLRQTGVEFRGTTEVKHLVQVLTEDIGLEKIGETVQRPLKDLRVAEHCGCHLLRPFREAGFDDPENPKVLKGLIEATGAVCLDYADEARCCGSTVAGVDDRVPLHLTREKLRNVGEVGAQALVTVCPSCFLMFDTNQLRMERAFGERLDIPVLHYPELLALAMGLGPEELALDEHRVSVLDKMALFR